MALSFNEDILHRSSGYDVDEETAIGQIVSEAERDGWEVVKFISRRQQQVLDKTRWTATIQVREMYKDNTIPGCKGCGPGFHPDHYPSKGCLSGKRPHCTCDYCF